MKLTVRITTELRNPDQNIRWMVEQTTVHSHRRGHGRVARALLDISESHFHETIADGWTTQSVNVDLIDGPDQGSNPVRAAAMTRPVRKA